MAPTHMAANDVADQPTARLRLTLARYQEALGQSIRGGEKSRMLMKVRAAQRKPSSLQFLACGPARAEYLALHRSKRYFPRCSLHAPNV